MSDRPSLTTATAVNLQAIHPDIPVEKLGSMVGRTLIGALFVLVGLALLFLLVGLPAYSVMKAGTTDGLKTIPLVIGFAGGVGMVILGATVWSSQLVARPLALVIASFKGIWQTVRGTSGS